MSYPPIQHQHRPPVHQKVQSTIAKGCQLAGAQWITYKPDKWADSTFTSFVVPRHVGAHFLSQMYSRMQMVNKVLHELWGYLSLMALWHVTFVKMGSVTSDANDCHWGNKTNKDFILLLPLCWTLSKYQLHQTAFHWQILLGQHQHLPRTPTCLYACH